MDGNPEVRRFFSIATGDSAAEDTPATRRHAPRKLSVIFIVIFSTMTVSRAHYCQRLDFVEDKHIS
jgi:hypothetical protein